MQRLRECDGYQCGYCTSGQIMSAVALLEEPRSRRCRRARSDERQPVPLRRLPEYRHGDSGRARKAEERAHGTLPAFAGARRARRDPGRRSSRTAQQGADVRFLAGGTTLLDLMKLNVERPGRVIDISRLPLNDVEATADGGVKIGATVRNADLAQHPLIANAMRCCRRRCSRAPRRNCATWRRPAATCCSEPVASISAIRDAMQQARARLGLLGDRRLQPHAGDPRRERRLHREQSVGHERRADGARSDASISRARGANARSPSTTSSCCPARTRARDRARTGRPRSRTSRCRRRHRAAARSISSCATARRMSSRWRRRR